MNDKTPLICKANFNENGEVEFESAKTSGLTLSQTIEDDKKYGVMTPANGKYFTYSVLNEDDEFIQKQVHKAIRYAYKKWWVYSNIEPLKKADYGELADFRVEFRTVESDPDKQLSENTIMYHYFPIGDVHHRLRGLCVVNKRFFFTSHGDTVTGTEMQRHGVKVQSANGKYKTIDFDVVYAHEFGHGNGLPHDTEPGSIMSTPYSVISEMPSMRDQARIKAKKGHRHMSGFRLLRWLRWLVVASDR